MSGEVKYLYRSWAFIYCRTHLENSGMIVAKARQLAQIGGNSSAPANSGFAVPGARTNSVQALNGTGRGGGGQRGRGGGGQRGGQRPERNMIGKTAKIVAVSRGFFPVALFHLFRIDETA